MKLREAIMAALYSQQSQLAAMQLQTSALIELVIDAGEDEAQPVTTGEEDQYVGEWHTDDYRSHPHKFVIKTASFDRPHSWLCTHCGRKYNGAELIKEDL